MIALFDSGIGGLTVLGSLWHRLPQRDYLYLSDQAHFPYGDRPEADVRRDVAAFAAYARAAGAEALVLACNTASAIALEDAKAAFDGPTYGVIAEVAAHAAARSRCGIVGVLATTNTCRTHAYRDAVGARVEEVACPDLIALAEFGGANDQDVAREAAEPLAALRAAGADVVILGCTHLPHFERALRELTAPWATLLDPGEALAKRLARDLPERRENGTVRCETTGDPAAFARRLGQELPKICARATVAHIASSRLRS
ncbi:MAG: glutamate racemase [Thermaerobacter sp.]|nr:glutamate racemase [Thermaerobacter sp.]